MFHFVGTSVATLSWGLQRLGPKHTDDHSSGGRRSQGDSKLKDTGWMEGCEELGSGPPGPRGSPVQG